MIRMLVGSGIFISAFLLFFVQLLLAKHLLPQFGGGAFVWITCMIFFQTSLLLGYLYAYLLAKLASIRIQAMIHFALIVASLYFMPINLDSFVIDNLAWPPTSICLLLASIILLPFIVISASNPLLQHWYCHVKESEFPYYFYSISNAGSLIGLLGYPFLLEPSIGLHKQGLLWTVLYIGYCCICAIFMSLFAFKKQARVIENQKQDVTLLKASQWLMLSFLTCALLLSITQFLAQNIINLPLIWVLPLALYLISYIVTFSKESGYQRSFWICAFFVFLTLTLWLSYQQRLVGFEALLILLGLLFIACMICHGELVRRKPSKNSLTTFYLLIALGGVLGSVFVNMAAFVFHALSWDFYLPLALITGLTLFLAHQHYKDEDPVWIFNFLTITCSVIIVILFSLILFQPKISVLAQKRSVYGLIRVIQKGAFDDPYRFRDLRNGQILHGIQFQSAEKELTPTSYYGVSSGVELAFRYLHQQHDRPLNIAAIGLGCGTIAVLAKKGDHVDFYEIDQNVIDYANQYFSFLKKSPANHNIILGDARLSLVKSRFAPNFKKYDLIVADAFSGDAVPSHLLTQEAVALYRSLLNPNGIIAFHTTNTYIDFMPLTKKLAQDHSLNHSWIQTALDLETFRFYSDWAILTSDPHFSEWLRKVEGINLLDTKTELTIDWTDDYNSVLPLFKLKLL